MKRKPEDAIDPMSIDPTLRLDLLARAQSQQLETLGRNPFQFGQPPAPPIPPAPPVAARVAVREGRSRLIEKLRVEEAFPAAPATPALGVTPIVSYFPAAPVPPEPPMAD